ncbi:MAG: hypothetical protein Q9171_005781 [Xanthocarpia ochracea]
MELSLRNLDAPLASNTSESSSDSQDKPQVSRRTSHFVRESVVSAIIYNQGRRKGSQEAEVSLRQRCEDMDRKFLADLERERDEQRQTVDQIRRDHRIEATITSLTAKRHVDGARLATQKYQVALEKECEQTSRKMAALTVMHEQERQQMKDEHEYKVDHLYNKISKLVAEKADNQDAVRGAYDSALTQKQEYIEMLEKKLQAVEERSRAWGSFSNENGTPAAKVNGLVKEVTVTRGAPFVGQMSEIQQLRRTNAEQANLIFGLQASLSNLGRQLTEVRAALVHAYPGHPLAVPRTSHPPYREESQGNFTPPPIPYPHQAVQYANGSNAQHVLPPVPPFSNSNHQ